MGCALFVLSARFARYKKWEPIASDSLKTTERVRVREGRKRAKGGFDISTHAHSGGSYIALATLMHMRVCVRMRVCARACVRVRVRAQERERASVTEREWEGEGERERE